MNSKEHTHILALGAGILICGISMLITNAIIADPMSALDTSFTVTFSVTGGMLILGVVLPRLTRWLGEE